ncbi:GAF domain-containing protein [Methylobacterium longum]|uniref:histidine kinase n=2 Tax=Methylobacterium longum TaxID=767694 RepID=A0ABT8AHK3_9HYPH|nr:GAF domain-containing protein [Methylobacterium longum]MDN3569289.1 GAF domain-containing protein [Methylobacterium longum]
MQDTIETLQRDLDEARRQQIATAGVLKVISGSVFDLQVVLDTLITSAVKLCDSDCSNIFQRQGDIYRLVSSYGFSEEYIALADTHPLRAGGNSTAGRVAFERRPVQVLDVLTIPNYAASEYQRLGGYRTLFGVPLLRNGEPVGVLLLGRFTVRAFTERQIELVQTFADQAVIAIENARLFNEIEARTRELTEALALQTATSEVLRVISRSAFDLQAVLDTLVQSAARLCGADQSCVFERDGEVYRWLSGFGFSDEVVTYAKAHPFAPGVHSATSRVARSGEVVHIPDVLADSEYAATEHQRLGQYRTMLGVPLLREGAPIGVFTLGRTRVEPFNERQIDLVRGFSDQAVIAIENVRLFEQLQARTRELAHSLHELRSAQDRLIHTEKLASLGQLTAGIAHEIKNPLNFVNNFAALSSELVDELQEALQTASLDGRIRAEIDELADLLKGNLAKVVQHGERADSIVKNMLLHSRTGSGERRPVDVNNLVEESLNLAYHGARAQEPSFNVTLSRNFDPAAGAADLYPQEVTRVLLNLVTNGFYAVAKRADGAGAGYQPTLTVTTRDLGRRVEIRVRDNGIGVPESVRAKMFDPFYTTKPAGEGTGLGLSLSHDIVVKQHGGTIDVVSEAGQFTEFTIVLPRGGAEAVQPGSAP